MSRSFKGKHYSEVEEILGERLLTTEEVAEFLGVSIEEAAELIEAEPGVLMIDDDGIVTEEVWEQ